MRAALLLLIAGAPPTPGIDAGEFARGEAAVGERPSEAIALRQAQAPSRSFRLGAAYRAWRNAGGAIDHDASHPTGDGGDEEVLAEDCSDERIAFIAVENEREAMRLTPDQVAAAVRSIASDAAASWRARRHQPPAPCRR